MEKHTLTTGEATDLRDLLNRALAEGEAVTLHVSAVGAAATTSESTEEAARTSDQEPQWIENLRADLTMTVVLEVNLNVPAYTAPAHYSAAAALAVDRVFAEAPGVIVNAPAIASLSSWHLQQVAP